MDIFGFLSTLGVNVGAITLIAAAVQGAKKGLEKELTKLIPDAKLRGWLYVAAVAVIGTAVALVEQISIGFNVWTFILSAFKYSGGSIFAYEFAKFAFLKEEPAAPQGTK